MSKSSEEIVREIKALKNKIAGKFELTMGLRIWGSTTGDETGTLKVLKVSSDGSVSTTT